MMKIFAVFFVLILSIQYVCLAHDPSKIDVEFNPKNNVLAVYVTHDTDDPLAHGVKEVSVYLNDKAIITQEILRQDDEMGLMVNYRVNGVSNGDIIKVKALCNMGGEVAGELKAE